MMKVINEHNPDHFHCLQGLGTCVYGFSVCAVKIVDNYRLANTKLDQRFMPLKNLFHEK